HSASRPDPANAPELPAVTHATQNCTQCPSRAWASSSGVTLAVPSLPTTTPAAVLARTAASAMVGPAATASASTPSTVSSSPCPGHIKDLAAGRATFDAGLAHARVGYVKAGRWNVQQLCPTLFQNVHSHRTVRDDDGSAAEMFEQLLGAFVQRFFVIQSSRKK